MTVISKNILPLVLLLLASCTGAGRLRECAVEVNVSPGLRADTVTLHVVEPGYEAERVMGEWHAADSTACRFTTQLDGEREAYLTFGRGSREFWFVLHPGHIVLGIEGGKWTVSGSGVNGELARLVECLRGLREQRAALARRYGAAVAYSTLTAAADSAMWARDSVLTDSLRCLDMMADTCGLPLWRAARHHFDNLGN